PSPARTGCPSVAEPHVSEAVRRGCNQLAGGHGVLGGCGHQLAIQQPDGGASGQPVGGWQTPDAGSLTRNLRACCCVCDGDNHQSADGVHATGYHAASGGGEGQDVTVLDVILGHGNILNWQSSETTKPARGGLSSRAVAMIRHRAS